MIGEKEVTYIPASVGKDGPVVNASTTKADFIPANMPGCQMMANLEYTPVGFDGLLNCRGRDLDYVPATSIGKDARWKREQKVDYVPCSSSVSPGPPGAQESTTCKLSWWEENSFFRYHCMLISAFYGMKWKDNFREYFNIPDDFIIIGDSGGFQNMTQDAHLDPIEVLRWQEKHCQIGLIFDLPVLDDDPPSVVIKKQKQTVMNAKKALENRKNENLKLYAVMHGHTVEELERMIKYYDEHCPLEKFDGISIGSITSDAGNLDKTTNTLLMCLSLLQRFDKPVHFLGISGDNLVPVILHLQKKFGMPITFDSSSYGGGAIRKEFWCDSSRVKIPFTEKGNTLKRIPCHCPVCSKCSVDDFFAEGSLSGGLLALHNLWQTLVYVDKVKRLSDDYECLLQFVKVNCRPEVLVQFEKVDYFVEHGLDKGMRKYGVVQTKNNLKTTNLFGF